MLLIGKPEKNATFEVVTRIVLFTIGRFRSRRTGDDPLGLIINILDLLDLDLAEAFDL